MVRPTKSMEFEGGMIIYSSVMAHFVPEL